MAINETTTINDDQDCEHCGETARARVCEGCGAAARITDCGHKAQPRMIAPGRADGSDLQNCYCVTCAYARVTTAAPRWRVAAVEGVDADDFGDGAFDGDYATEAEAEEALQDLAWHWAEHATRNGGDVASTAAEVATDLQVVEVEA